MTIPCTLHYKTHKPEKDGLICQRIFRPEESIKGLKIGSNILDCMDHEPSLTNIGKTIFGCTTELAMVLTCKITNGIEDMQQGSLEMGNPWLFSNH